jgi:uncharacterized membrane protein YdjX (TVP38/TMEM64 family)
MMSSTPPPVDRESVAPGWPPRSGMRLATVVGGILAVLLTAYLAVEAAHVEPLSDPRDSLESAGIEKALVALGLLVADALVPVASSVVMISLGALYGAPLGIALAWAGRFAMALAGFAIGRRAGGLMERVLGPREYARANDLVARRGAFAIVVSRPLPLVAETVTIVAGASGMPWRRAVVASAIGSLPEAVVYGVAGSASVRFDEGAVVWVVMLLVASLFWFADHSLRRRATRGDGRGIAGAGRP